MEVYIVLTDTGTIFTRLLKMYTKHSLNHASISFTKDLATTYSFGRKSHYNPFIGGFVKEDMSGKLFEQATCAIYSCSVSESVYSQMLETVQQMEKEQHNYKYNFIGLFGILLNRRIDRENAYFCSEFVATILNKGGISFKNKPACLVKPYELIDYGQFRLVYEGKLKTYLLQKRNASEQDLLDGTIKRRKIVSLDTIFLKRSKTIAS
jgi:hypothetical protein